MTRQEFEYIKRAVEALESGDHSLMSEHKILKTISQLTDRAAQQIEDHVAQRVDQNIANQNLVDMLSK